jgi:serine/threonine-protein kinase
MILWITVIYNPTHGPRWLPCYLDLKTESARQVVFALSQLGSYKILFFALEEPEKCQHSMISTIASNQCTIMKEWIKNTTIPTPEGDAKVSRKRLRDEFERLKPRILEKLAQSYQ